MSGDPYNRSAPRPIDAVDFTPATLPSPVKFIVLLRIHRIHFDEIVVWRDEDEVVRVFSTEEQAAASACANRATKVFGFQVVPFTDNWRHS